MSDEMDLCPVCGFKAVKIQFKKTKGNCPVCKAKMEV